MIRSKTVVTSPDVARHYDDLDRFYRRIWGEHVHHGYWTAGIRDSAAATDNLVDAVAERLKIRPGDRVCDIGCGYGATVRRLADKYHATITGVTLSHAQFEFAVRAGDSARILQMDWLDNGFEGESFDAVFSIESSEHMPDLPRFFSEALRTLRPGGRFAVCAWLSRRQPSAWQQRWLLEPICREGRLAYLGTSDEYCHLMQAAGFSGIEHQDISAQVSRTWSICIQRTIKALLTDADARRFLFDRKEANRVFAATLVRIRAAYALGALRYGIFTAAKPLTGADPTAQPAAACSPGSG